jgi:hypothetical protein
MKQAITFILVLIGSLPFYVQAQRFSAGLVAGAGNRMLGAENSTNTQQYNWAIGLDGDVRIWRQLYGVSRVEFTRKNYTQPIFSTTILGETTLLQQDAVRYFAGLGWKTKSFYTNAGFFYNDFLGGSEPYQDLVMCCFGDCPPYTPDGTREKFNFWGYYGSAGLLRPLTPRAKVLFEINYSKEFGIIYSHSIETFRAVGFRAGVKVGI